MKTFTTVSDIGCIKLFTQDTAFYFRNNFGDVENTVNIYEEPERPEKDFTMVGSFDVLNAERRDEEDGVYLADLDVSYNPIFTFYKPGRYFVYLNDKGARPVFHIQWLDNAI